jgi:hypothetical protein
VQQASLLGNMEAFGLLEKLKEEEFANRGSAPSETTSASHAAKQRAIVELGAGRGYLSHMLCDCYSVHKVVMIERRAYKFKVLRLEHCIFAPSPLNYCEGDVLGGAGVHVMFLFCRRHDVSVLIDMPLN